MIPNLSTATVPEHMNNTRLDGALSLFLPDAGIRTRRRIFDTHTVLVNGIPRSKGHTVSTGDQILLVEKTAPQETAEKYEENAKDTIQDSSSELKKELYIVHEDALFAAIYKPGGLHTATIAGKDTSSLETELPKLFADVPLPILVNRLDHLTSGMVMAAKSEEAAALFREIENAGAVEKIYLLLVHGSVPAPLQVTNKLDMAKRKVTKVLPEADPDPLRHTTFLPLLETTVPGDPSSSATLLMAAISKGARHQIRAHIASQGFPIVGDPLYGVAETHPTQIMYLHHYQIELGTFAATCPPNWPSWDLWKNSIPNK
ncbi:pseudouridine synthase family protein [Halodesulfovibrio marinisediminis]|uniref:23S rRNA pseudouridine1911/1915/1917 synthase n=1 Tax=Halodesulfovibrio marinisediminis DSM 17456 TaxID=1121457 RepID=A0A1N6H8R7_9BACT|nr:RNA pseudouridine synthase [Halodesulfovibrio marinisediminis]SIO16109.1 23S rRNA pseudouridine1911/1915/1917 synthase [Halodesulfovibrio marinisediminis DSM 17456]